MNLRLPNGLPLFVLVAASCAGATHSSGPVTDGSLDQAVVDRGAAEASTDTPMVDAPPADSSTKDAEADAVAPTDLGAAGEGGRDAEAETRLNLDAADAGCVPVVDGPWFVDPVAGSDAFKSTGALGCPVRSIFRALTLLGAARGAPDAGASPPAATIAIVNETPNVLLAADEHFPLMVPANVTISASDVARPSPTLAVPESVRSGFIFSGDGWRLSHVAMTCVKNSPSSPVNVSGSGQLDHVSVDGCAVGAQITGGAVVVGPGFVARGNNRGIYVGNAKVTLVGGQGADHTSLTGNTRFGAWVRGNVGAEARLLVSGADTTPATAAASNVDLDANGEAGIYLELGPTVLDMTGAHISENPTGLRANAGPATITVKHTFLANNRLSAVSFGTSFWTATDAVSFGSAAGQAWGHNVFSVPNQAATVNTEGALCVPPASPLRISAAGNVFGAIDCVAGGALRRAAACTSQVDVAVADVTAIDLAGCTLAP